MADKEFTNINGIYVCDQTARNAIPTKTSDLTNDSGFITADEVPSATVPTKISELENDKDYATNTEVDTKIANASLGGGEVDLSGYAKTTDIPTNVSQLTNDSGYINDLGSNKLFLMLLNQLGCTLEDLSKIIPTVKIVGDLTGITDTVYKDVTCDFTDIKNDIAFTDYATIAWQGSGSLVFPKKNYKIKLFKDEARTSKSKKQFKDWPSTNNFHLKCNFADATNIMNNMMMHYISKSYQYLDPLPREGARFTVDGFPILLYVNDIFVGIYFWNLKQDDKIYNLNEEVTTEDGTVTQEADLCYQIGLNEGSNVGDNSGAFVYGNLNEGSNSGKNFADAHAEIDYYWEDRVWDKTSNHPDVLYDTIQWVSEAGDYEFKNNLANYFDVNYLINYFIIIYVCAMIDSKCKNFNMLYFPDKAVWYATFWDMDNAFGTGYSVGTTAYNVELEKFGSPSSRLFDKLWFNFRNEIVAKYTELRQTLFTLEQVEDSINYVLRDVTDKWLAANFDAKYSDTSYSGKEITDPKTYILNWAEQRFSYMDSVMTEIEIVPCTDIAFSSSELTLTDTDIIDITPTVTPSNTSDRIIYSVTPEDIITIVDGSITAKSDGTCTITAVCGAVSATITVTVELEEETTTVDYSEGYIGSDGALTSGTDEYTDNNYITLNTSGGDGLCIIPPINVKNIRIAYYDANKTIISRDYHMPMSPTNMVRGYFSIPSNACYARVGFIYPSATLEILQNLFGNYTHVQSDIIDLSYELGSIDETSGELTTDTTRCRTDYIEVTPSSSTHIFTALSSGYIRFNVITYDSDKNYINNGGVNTRPQNVTLSIAENVKYIRLTLSYGTDYNTELSSTYFDGKYIGVGDNVCALIGTTTE